MAMILTTGPVGAAVRYSSFTNPDDYTIERVRVLNGPTRWYAVPVCAVFSHKWAATPWSRWAFGWDRETHCRRCGETRHERARLHAETVHEGED